MKRHVTIRLQKDAVLFVPDYVKVFKFEIDTQPDEEKSFLLIPVTTPYIFLHSVVSRKKLSKGSSSPFYVETCCKIEFK